jgi:hypothetical protein
LPWPHFELLNFVLGILSMAKIFFFWSWPLTFGGGVPKNDFSHAQNYKHKA